MFHFQDYEFLRADRSHGKGGGVGIYIHNQLKFKLRPDLHISGSEDIFIEIINSKSKNIIVGTIYRPPNNEIDLFLHDIDDGLHKILQENKNVYLMGDYNIDLLTTTQHNNLRFINILQSNAFYPHINKPTRIYNTSQTLIKIIYSLMCISIVPNGILYSGCVHAYFAKAESAFWNADSKRQSKTPLIQAIVRAQVNRKGVYMTSFKRGYNVILRSCFHQNQRFALTTIVNALFWAAFMLILREAFWNADSKRRSKTPFTEVLFMLPSRRRRYVYRRRHVSEFSECLIQAIVRAQVNRKGVYMTSFKRGYNVILRSMLPPESAFCSNHVRKRTFLGVLNRRFETRLF